LTGLPLLLLFPSFIYITDMICCILGCVENRLQRENKHVCIIFIIFVLRGVLKVENTSSASILHLF
jgi:hypothetical protein